MRRLLSLLVPVLAAAAIPATAQTITYQVTEQELLVDAVTGEIIEEGPVVTVASGTRDTPEDAANDLPYEDGTGQRFVYTFPPAVAQPAAAPKGLAAYGPFRVLDGNRAALVDITGDDAPARFAAMLRDYPGIRRLELIDAPGTENDRANLTLGRMIHARGIATHVPAGGSVRSGAVELFLAGTTRSAEDGAEFAVHAWEDEDGLQPGDYAADAPENRKYLDYYREMGMNADEARAFYAMTNSVPHAQAKWLTAADMRQWVRLD